MDEEGREEVVPEGLKGGGETFIPIMRYFFLFLLIMQVYNITSYFLSKTNHFDFNHNMTTIL